MKFVINKCYGGFGLSDLALAKLGVSDFDDYEDNRDDLDLIKVVEDLGEEANGNYSDLEVVSIPDISTDWYISEYDGLETLIYVVDGKLKFA